MRNSNQFAVVFDTNAYRTLSFKRDSNRVRSVVSNLIGNENNNGIQAFANPFVMLELASHLADVNDKAYKNCKSAVVALAQHCTLRKDGKQIGLLADSESQLCKTLFDECPPQHLDTTEKLAKIYAYIAECPSESRIEKIRGDLDEIATFTGRTERRFISDMKRYVVLGFDPRARDWTPLKENKQLRNKALQFLSSRDSLLLLAKTHAIKACLLLNKRIDSSQVDSMAGCILENFEAPLRLYNEIVKRIVETGCDLSKKKRGNYIWDIQVAFVIGSNHRTENKLVRLVTGDRDIVKAANDLTAIFFSLIRYGLPDLTPITRNVLT